MWASLAAKVGGAMLVAGGVVGPGCATSPAADGAEAEALDGQASDSLLVADGDGDDVGWDGPSDDALLDLDGTPCIDRDGDGFAASDCGGPDCDDSSPAIHPGAPDVCNDGVDSDCDGVDPAGGLLGAPLLVWETDDARHPESTLLLWTGAEFALFRRQYARDGLFLDRLSEAGEPLSGPVRISDYRPAFNAIWAKDCFAAVWSEALVDQVDVRFQLLSYEGTPASDEIALTDSGSVTVDASTSYGPAIAELAAGYGIAWLDRRGGLAQAYGMQVAWDGSRRTPDAQLTHYTVDAGSGLAVTSSGGQFGILSSEAGDGGGPQSLFFLRVGEDGEVDSETTLTHSAVYSGPTALLGLTSRFAALWLDTSNVFRLGVVNLDGAIGGTAAVVRLEGSAWSVEGFSAVWNGTAVGIAWSEASVADTRLRLAEFNPDGAPIGSVVELVVSHATEVHLVWAGDAYGVTWEERDDLHRRIYFGRVRMCGG